MGAFTQRNTGRAHQLSRHVVVGRSSTATFRIDEVRVSGRHAAIRWDGSRWEVKDLHSTNGTFVGGKRLAPGSSVTLSAGDDLAFGSLDTVYVLSDASPPQADALLVANGTQAALRLEGGICILPDADAPELTIYRDNEGTWWCERDELPEPLSLREGAEIVVRGERFKFTTSLAAPETCATAVDPALLHVKDLVLDIAFSKDEERVELSASAGDQKLLMGARSFFYLLLTLARVRLGITLPKNEPCQDGWVLVETLEQMLNVSRNQINLDVCRARQVFRDHGVCDPAAIIERRRNMIRIGTSAVEVRRV